MKYLSVCLICWFLFSPAISCNTILLNRFVHRVLHQDFNDSEYFDRIVKIYVPLSGADENELCRNHSLFYRDGLMGGEPWALNMLDASSKVPDGVMTGNLVHLGNYDQCVGVEDVQSDAGKFSGQHCLVQIQREGVEIAPIAEMITPRMTDVNGSLLTLDLALRWSVCVPSSCRADDVQANLRDALAPLSVRVDAVNCNTRAKEVNFSTLDWVAVGLLSFFAILVLLSTTYDLTCSGADRPSLLVAFSLSTNGNNLLTVSHGDDYLPAVDGIRFLSMIWAILGHRFWSEVATASVNFMDSYNDLYSWKHIYFTNWTLAIDSFLLLNGILLSYVFLNEMSSGKWFKLPWFYLHRFVRCSPALAVVILWTATLAPYMGDGPFWAPQMQRDKDNCLTSWWTLLTYANNYYNVNESCLGHTWYLAVDMQLFCLSPLILYPLWKCPTAGRVFLAAFIGLGLVITFLAAYINNFTSWSLQGSDEYLTHTRFTPWLIGMGLGYILHETKNITIHLSPVLVVLGWMLSATWMLSSLLLAHRFREDQHEPLLTAVYVCLRRPAWTLGLAWVVFANVKGYGGFVNKFLSWNVFQVLVKLTYSMYLVHWPLQRIIMFSIRTPQYINDTILWWHCFGDVGVSLAAAVILYLVFESPAVFIERQLLQRYTDVSPCVKKKTEATNDCRDLNNVRSFENKEYDGPEPNGEQQHKSQEKY